MSKWAAVFVMLVIACKVVSGEPAPTNTVITSGQLTFDYKRSIAIFEKDVVAVDATMKLECDRLTVLFDKKNEVKSLSAVGNVKMTSEGRTGTCKKAIYLAKTGELLMTGDARLSRGRDTVSGKRITIWLNDDRMICEPGRLVIYPGAKQDDSLLDGLGGKKKSSKKGGEAGP